MTKFEELQQTIDIIELMLTQYNRDIDEAVRLCSVAGSLITAIKEEQENLKKSNSDYGWSNTYRREMSF